MWNQQQKLSYKRSSLSLIRLHDVYCFSHVVVSLNSAMPASRLARQQTGLSANCRVTATCRVWRWPASTQQWTMKPNCWEFSTVADLRSCFWDTHWICITQVREAMSGCPFLPVGLSLSAREVVPFCPWDCPFLPMGLSLSTHGVVPFCPWGCPFLPLQLSLSASGVVPFCPWGCPFLPWSCPFLPVGLVLSACGVFPFCPWGCPFLPLELSLFASGVAVVLGITLP